MPAGDAIATTSGEHEDGEEDECGGENRRSRRLEVVSVGNDQRVKRWTLTIYGDCMAKSEGKGSAPLRLEVERSGEKRGKGTGVADVSSLDVLRWRHSEGGEGGDEGEGREVSYRRGGLGEGKSVIVAGVGIELFTFHE